MTRTNAWTTLGVILLLVAAVGPAPAAAAEVSGTVVSVDVAGGALVVEEIGPWQVKDGRTVTQRHTVVIGPETEVIGAMRAPELAPSGWIGDFVHVALGLEAIQAGDFVTMHLVRAAKGWRATRVTIAGN
jgi:hypothetical protein